MYKKVHKSNRKIYDDNAIYSKYTYLCIDLMFHIIINRTR